jgi:hypothetical protein
MARIPWLEMYDVARENELDLEALRTRLRRMSDSELIASESPHATCARRRRTSAKSRAECS